MVKELNERFAIPNVLYFEQDEHGMERAVVQTSHAHSKIYLNGAHVTEFTPTGHRPVIFLSSKSKYSAGSAIRGGVPIIFPWFGARSGDPKAPMHGIARTSQWQLIDSRLNGEIVEVRFRLDIPDEYRLEYAVRIGGTLEMELAVQNSSTGSSTFEEALHTYLAVSDVRQVQLRGFKGKTFVDKTDGMRRKRTDDTLLRIDGETDRVYSDVGATTVEDPGWARRIFVSKFGSATTVVWNPWAEKARNMPDFGEDEWRSMLCIETANVAENKVALPPGVVHRMWAILSVEGTI